MRKAIRPSDRYYTSFPPTTNPRPQKEKIMPRVAMVSITDIIAPLTPSKCTGKVKAAASQPTTSPDSPAQEQRLQRLRLYQQQIAHHRSQPQAPDAAVAMDNSPPERGKYPLSEQSTNLYHGCIGVGITPARGNHNKVHICTVKPLVKYYID